MVDEASHFFGRFLTLYAKLLHDKCVVFREKKLTEFDVSFQSEDLLTHVTSMLDKSSVHPQRANNTALQAIIKLVLFSICRRTWNFNCCKQNHQNLHCIRLNVTVLHCSLIFLRDKATQSNIFVLWSVCPNFKSTHINGILRREKKPAKADGATWFI